MESYHRKDTSKNASLLLVGSLPRGRLHAELFSNQTTLYALMDPVPTAVSMTAKRALIFSNSKLGEKIHRDMFPTAINKQCALLVGRFGQKQPALGINVKMIRISNYKMPVLDVLHDKVCPSFAEHLLNKTTGIFEPIDAVSFAV